MPVLFKGARVTAHLLQNLALLALPEGASLETSYGQRWIAPNADGSKLTRSGETVLVVLCSPPYEVFVPARLARLTAVEARGSFFSFQMLLGSFVAVVDQLRLAELIAEWDHELRPSRKFLSRGLAVGEIR